MILHLFKLLEGLSNILKKILSQSEECRNHKMNNPVYAYRLVFVRNLYTYEKKRNTWYSIAQRDKCGTVLIICVSYLVINFFPVKKLYFNVPKEPEKCCV